MTTTNATPSDQDLLQRWRLVVQLAVESRHSHDVYPMLAQLVSVIERTTPDGHAAKLVELRERHGLTVEQQRVLTTVLVDRRGRLTAAELSSVAWLKPIADLDWETVAAQLARLEELWLIRAVDLTETARTSATRYAPGTALGWLKRLTTDVPAAPAPPARWALKRWELEQWAIVFRTRQAFHRWIRAHHDPYKAFIGNFANTVDAPRAEALYAEAERLEEELISGQLEGDGVVGRMMRAFSVGPAEARVMLYMYLTEVMDCGLGPEGRSVIAAVSSDWLLARMAIAGARTHESIADLTLGTASPLIKQNLVQVTVNGNTPYSACYAIGRAAMGIIYVDPAARPPSEVKSRVSAESLGEVRDPRVEMKDVVLPVETREELMDALALADGAARAQLPEATRARLFTKGRGAVLLFEGPPGTGKTMAAEAIAMHLGRRVYVARYEQVEDFLLGNSQKNIGRLFEEATRANALLLLDEADALVARRTPVHQAWDQHRNSLVNLLLGRLEEHEGVVVLTTNLGVNLDPALERRLTARVRFGLPGLPERELLWRQYLPSDVPIHGEVDVERLARQHPMSGARVRNAVLAALRKALRRTAAAPGEVQLALEATEIVESAAEEFRSSYRDRSARDDGAEAVEVGELKAPTYELSAVVLPEDVRRRLTEVLVALSPAARSLFESAAFAETFRTGRGVVLLFEGPPGTGKTMTAEAVAGQIGKQLYMVTPERLLSKWHGQSERALARVFDEAEAGDAVLVLDEADSLLEARTDAGEWGARTANQMINLLLRRLEEFPGVAILITNRAGNLDPALERRLAARVVFAPPDISARAEILKKHIPAGVSLAPDVDLLELARAHPVAGGRLRNAVLTALRRMVLADPAARTLTRAMLESGLSDAAESGSTRKIGFTSAPPPA